MTIHASDGKDKREVWKIIVRLDGTFVVFFRKKPNGKVEPGNLESTDERLKYFEINGKRFTKYEMNNRIFF